ncbi:hypothetical protein [Dietzia cinnamea]|uniref:hypothetical protein n=1 Tax=Dietzia cinnamea TaxID=321318 RepID=UPI0021A396A8|nr:hypothetical protein [Dietzia cinnamea]MCT2140999.1 hypothetical protein [Dietzia cinnamea]
MRFRNARSGVDDATSVVELRRVQRSRLGHDRERFHRRNNLVLVHQRIGSSRRSTDA